MRDREIGRGFMLSLLLPPPTLSGLYLSCVCMRVLSSLDNVLFRTTKLVCGPSIIPPRPGLCVREERARFSPSLVLAWRDALSVRAVSFLLIVMRSPKRYG